MLDLNAFVHDKLKEAPDDLGFGSVDASRPIENDAKLNRAYRYNPTETE